MTGEHDPLDGFRGVPIDEDQQMMLDAMRGDAHAVSMISLAGSVRRFLSSDVGEHLLKQVDEAEQRFLDEAKSYGHTEVEDFKLAHFNYLVAVQSMLWLGSVLADAESIESLREQEMAGDDLADS